jgi:hypothetical protein
MKLQLEREEKERQESRMQKLEELAKKRSLIEQSSSDHENLAVPLDDDSEDPSSEEEKESIHDNTVTTDL